MSFVDITTTRTRKTAVKRGDYNAAESTQLVFSKKTGQDTSIRRGYCLTLVDDVTPNKFAVTTGKSANTVVIAGMPLYPNRNNTNVTNAVDGNGEDVCAEEADVAFQGVIRSNDIVVKAKGAIQPGQQVMSADLGDVAAYDGSGPEYVIGFMNGLVGSVTDNAIIKQACADKDLISINFNGGV